MAFREDPRCLGGAHLQPIETATTVRYGGRERIPAVRLGGAVEARPLFEIPRGDGDSRRDARVVDGQLIRLAEQDRSRHDRAKVKAGRALLRALALRPAFEHALRPAATDPERRFLARRLAEL